MDETAQERKQQRSAERIAAQHRTQRFKRILWISIAMDVFLLDQLSKWAITELLYRPRLEGQEGYGFFEWYLKAEALYGHVQIEITSFFNLVLAWNTGVSFSMFSNAGPYMPYILIAVATAIAGLFAVWLWREDKHSHGICYALVIGGALGNIVDRARFGAVIDFLDFHAYGYHWPAFNVADMGVVIGICLLIIVSLFFDIRQKARYRKRGL